MDARQESFLKLVVEEYIATAEPVGSRALCEKYDLDVSPATVRNDMAALEEEGYLRAPHTSAGRVPTEKAFVHYLQRFVEPNKRQAPDMNRMRTPKAADGEETVKTLAKTLSELSGEMAIAAFDEQQSYYVGVGNLFSKPDFGDLAVIKSLAQMMDRFDDVMGEVFERIPGNPLAMIGSENPFGSDMSAIMVKYRLPSGHIGLLGLVGPMRMDYGRNIALLERAKEILDQTDE